MQEVDAIRVRDMTSCLGPSTAHPASEYDSSTTRPFISPEKGAPSEPPVAASAREMRKRAKVDIALVGVGRRGAKREW
jgi:hypothetical protein